MLTSVNLQFVDGQHGYLNASILIAIDLYLDTCVENSTLITQELITEEDKARTRNTLFRTRRTINGALYANLN